jgi:hypothetical protein
MFEMCTESQQLQVNEMFDKYVPLGRHKPDGNAAFADCLSGDWTRLRCCFGGSTHKWNLRRIDRSALEIT